MKSQFTRFFLAVLAALSVLNSGMEKARAAKFEAPDTLEPILVYVGTYTNAQSRGIYLYRMDRNTGALESLGLAAETPNPSFLELDADRRVIYAANELDHFEGRLSAGGISAFKIQDSGLLKLINQRPSGGSGACHLLLDHSGHNILAANYTAGSVAVLPVARDGHLADPSATVQHKGKSVDPDRQSGPHAHCITLDENNRFAYACDLGIDKILIYSFDRKKGALNFNQPSSVSIKPGSGPRHLVLHPDNRHAYLVNELEPTVIAFKYDSKHGNLEQIQAVSTLPADFKGANYPAEIAIHPTGKYLYVSNRGHDSIAVFGINGKSGELTLIDHQSTQGKTPRHFAIDPSGRCLLVANQDSGNVVSFSIDPWSGRLKPTGKSVSLANPACVLFLPNH